MIDKKIFALIISLMLIIIMLNSVGENISKSEKNCKTLDSGYTIEHDGEISENVVFENYKFGADKGDTFIITRIFQDSEKSNKAMTLSLVTYFSRLKVYLNDELLYDYGEGYSGIHYIEMPEEYAGETLKIVLIANAESDFDYLDAPLFDEYYKVKTNCIYSNMNVFLLDVGLITVGFIFLILSIFMSVDQGKIIKLFYLSLFCMNIGIWALAYNKTFQFISANLHLNTCLEFISFFFMTIVLLGFYTDFNDENGDKLLIFLFKINLAFFTILLFISFFIDDKLWPTFLPYYQIFMAFVLIVLVIRAIKHSRFNKIIYKFIFIATVVSAGAIIGNIIEIYALDKLYSFSNFYQIVAYIYLFLVSIGYMLDMINTETEQAKKELLTKMAYSDNLTGLYNRYKFSNACKELSADKKDKYIIFFDVDGLKRINDYYGHMSGDRLLKCFAKKIS